MWRFLSLWWQRLGDLSESEVLFLISFLRQRFQLYQRRIHRYNLFQWWALFVWTCFFGLSYGFLRFTVYALALGLRVFFLPFRLLVELYVTPKSLGQRFLLGLIGWLESFFGLLWLRQWLLGPVREAITEAFWSRVYGFVHFWKKFFKDNPILQLILFLERWDNRLTRQQERLWIWYQKVIVDHFFGILLPSFYRSVRYWVGVRRIYLYAYFFHPSWKKYRQRYRSRYWEKLSANPNKPWAILSFLCRAFLKLPWVLYWGLRVLWLGLRFLGKVYQSFTPSNPATLSFRCRRPKPGRRFKRKRNWWDD